MKQVSSALNRSAQSPGVTRSTLRLAASMVGLLVSASALAQTSGIRREMIQQGDLSVPGFQVIQARAELAPGVAAGRHTHPGEEVTVMLEGELVLEIAGQPPRKVKAGEAFIIPAGVPHDARNEGSTPSRLLGTWIVEKGKPMASPAP